MAFRLTSLQDSVANKQDYLELGLNCADICGALDRGMNGKRPDDFSQSVCKAIRKLTMWAKVPVPQSEQFTDDAPGHTTKSCHGYSEECDQEEQARPHFTTVLYEGR